MIRQLLTLLLFIVATIGNSQRYAFVKYSELKLDQLEVSHTMYFPVSTTDLEESHILDTTHQFLNLSKEYKLNRYLRSLEKNGINSSDLFIATAILNIHKGAYIESKHALSRVNDDKFDVLKQLLEVDIDREINMIDSRPNFETYLKRYQAIVDNNPGNFILKKIIDVRIRFLRYDE